MSDDIRYYRKNLTSQGLIYLGGEELDISVRNLSITGLLAELGENNSIRSIKDLFEAIRTSPKIDLYLPEMHLMGEGEVVRADLIDGVIYLALEFRNISYDVDDVLYKRVAYRKNMVAPGLIVLNGEKHSFTTRNVSVHGLMIHLTERIHVELGTNTIFDFKRLDLRGEIKVAWIEDAEDGGTYMGLEYVHMEKTDIKGVPEFK
ncbi:MAG: PilZ domain-containing protein [Methylococcaceae bacterium]|nr:PilZ domain-containing protein [Methylococcaceae bacterium]